MGATTRAVPDDDERVGALHHRLVLNPLGDGPMDGGVRAMDFDRESASRRPHLGEVVDDRGARGENARDREAALHDRPLDAVADAGEAAGHDRSHHAGSFSWPRVMDFLRKKVTRSREGTSAARNEGRGTESIAQGESQCETERTRSSAASASRGRALSLDDDALRRPRLRGLGGQSQARARDPLELREVALVALHLGELAHQMRWSFSVFGRARAASGRRWRRRRRSEDTATAGRNIARCSLGTGGSVQERSARRASDRRHRAGSRRARRREGRASEHLRRGRSRCSASSPSTERGEGRVRSPGGTNRKSRRFGRG